MYKCQWQKNKEIHWVSVFNNRNIAVCFDSFEIECILQEVLNRIKEVLKKKKIINQLPSIYLECKITIL